MEVGGYLYFKFIHFYKSNLEQSLPPPALSPLETEDEMTMTYFSLLGGPLMSPQASTLSTPAWWLFISIFLL